MYAIYKCYTKYHEAELASIPKSRKDITSNTTILQVIPVFKDMKNIYDILYCLYAQGGFKSMDWIMNTNKHLLRQQPHSEHF